MANSVYRVTEIVGTSTRSWEDAVKSAVQTAAKSLRDLRVAEVGALDVTVGDDGKVKYYRAKVKLSFELRSSRKAWCAPRPSRRRRRRHRGLLRPAPPRRRRRRRRKSARRRARRRAAAASGAPRAIVTRAGARPRLIERLHGRGDPPHVRVAVHSNGMGPPDTCEHSARNRYPGGPFGSAKRRLVRDSPPSPAGPRRIAEARIGRAAVVPRRVREVSWRRRADGEIIFVRGVISIAVLGIHRLARRRPASVCAQQR